MTHLDLDAQPVPLDDVAGHRRASEPREHEAADAVDVVVLELEIPHLADLVEANRAAGQQHVVADGLEGRLGGFALVDVAHHFLDEVEGR